MSRLFTALRPLFAALPALGVLLWLLTPALGTIAELQTARDGQAHVSPGVPQEPAPTRLESDAAELLETSEEDAEHDYDADLHETSAEISSRDAALTLAGAHTIRPPRPATRGCCIRGPPHRSTRV